MIFIDLSNKNELYCKKIIALLNKNKGDIVVNCNYINYAKDNVKVINTTDERKLADYAIKSEMVLIFDIKNNSNNGCASFTLGILSTDKIKDELNWIPKYSIHDGFKRTIEYIESEIKNNDKKLIKKF